MTDDSFELRLRAELTRLSNAVPVDPAIDRATSLAVQPVRPRSRLNARVSLAGLVGATIVIVLIASIVRQPAVVAPASTSQVPSSPPTPPPTASPTLQRVTPSPLAPLSPADFWVRILSGGWESQYRSLKELIADSDAVVVGTVQSIDGPDSYDPAASEFLATTSVHVERVLHGTLPSDTLPVSVFLNFDSASYAELELRQLAASMPADRRAIFFVKNLAKYDKELSAPAATGYDPSLYFVHSIDGIFWESNGTARPAIDVEGWPGQFAGKPFDQVWMEFAVAAPLPLPTAELPSSTTPISAKGALEIAWDWEKDHGARLTSIALEPDYVDKNGTHHVAWRLEFPDIVDMSLAVCRTEPPAICSGPRQNTSTWYIDATTGAVISHTGSYPY